MKTKINKVTLQILVADLWSLPVDAVVHATDTDLTLEPGLRSRVGSQIIWELDYIGYCPVGEAVMTSAGDLPFARLIHAVGPRWGEGSERGKLASVTFECLRLTEEAGLKSLALPAISTGALGYPLENCATTMLTTIIDYTFEDLKHLRRVVLCLNDDHALDIFRGELTRQLAEVQPGDDANARV